jgi:flagellar basal-body rod modification protein FlgD
MYAINSSASASALTSPSVTSAADIAEVSTTSDFETFLRLLTTQMRNQDPLKPLDSTQFIAQLASFSSVEQQVATNKNLEGIQSLLAGGASGLASWLGAEVQAAMGVQWRGNPIDIEISPALGATRATLIVRGVNGEAVHRMTVDPAETAIVWNGDGADENSVYRFEVESWKGDELLGSAPGRAYATVSEIRVEHGAPVLVFPGGVRATEGDVTALRKPAV